MYARFTSCIIYTLAKDQQKGKREQGAKRNQLPARVFLKKKKKMHKGILGRLTAPGRGTGTSPLYITHLTKEVSTGTGVLYFPSANTRLMSDTRYAHTADKSDVSLK